MLRKSTLILIFCLTSCSLEQVDRIADYAELAAPVVDAVAEGLSPTLSRASDAVDGLQAGLEAVEEARALSGRTGALDGDEWMKIIGAVVGSVGAGLFGLSRYRDGKHKRGDWTA